jgi:hypothetical protein
VIRLPKAAEPLVSAFSVAFTRPTFQRVVVLMLGAILSLRYRTVTGMLRAMGPLARGHWSDFHRVLCRRVWSCWPLGKVLAAMVLELIPTDQPVICPVDDTTPQHKGKRVYGKGCHHDACRSTHSHMVWVWGRKWVVLSVSLIFHRHTCGQDIRPLSFAWYAKKVATFGDALTCVCRMCWAEVFQQSPKHASLTKLLRPLRIMLLDHLSRAA